MEQYIKNLKKKKAKWKPPSPKVQRSNDAHDRIADNLVYHDSILGWFVKDPVKYKYHRQVSLEQSEKNRILSNSEKEKIWNTASKKVSKKYR